ncbi:hypothetical protein [Geotalea toluenoxydans]|uniref:hypothetical protein n=1 Tax=Geotalea toluenoxydans TaxID=421624 RepID=UPI000A71EEB0|nr:hypothetical protein [Geotalea toluenoxydans]
MIGARRLPIGADVMAHGGVHFRVWAPKRKTVEVLMEGSLDGEQCESFSFGLTAEAGGYFSGFCRSALLDGSIAIVLTAALLFPILPRVFSLPDPTGRLASSIQASTGPTPIGAA